MVVEADLYDYLTDVAAIAALVSTRVYPLRLPQDASLPAVVYQRISGERVRSHDGPSGLGRGRFQISSWDDDYAGAKSLAEQIRYALDRSPRYTFGSLSNVSALLRMELDDYDPQTGYYRIIQDYQLLYPEETT
jgi:hypothetical protein